VNGVVELEEGWETETGLMEEAVDGVVELGEGWEAETGWMKDLVSDVEARVVNESSGTPIP